MALFHRAYLYVSVVIRDSRSRREMTSVEGEGSEGLDQVRACTHAQAGPCEVGHRLIAQHEIRYATPSHARHLAGDRTRAVKG